MAPVVFFDGVCNLCNRSVDFILRRDRQGVFKFASLQSSVAADLLKDKGINSLEMQSLILLKNNKVYLRSSAALEIARDLGGIWRIFYAFKLVPVFIRDGIYNFIASNRYRWFGKRESCRLPTPQESSRFLGDHNIAPVT